MIGPRGAALLLAFSALAPRGASSFPIQIETRSGPAPGGGETRLHVIVPAFDPGSSPRTVLITAMIFQEEHAAASGQWTARVVPGTVCRAPLAETRVFRLAPGSYRARIRVAPAEGKAAEHEISFRVPDPGTDLRLSELTLGCRPEGESLPDTLVPHGAPFGEGTLPGLAFRIGDARPDVPDTAYQVRVRVKSDLEDAIVNSWTLPRGDGIAEGRWSTEALPTGRYRLTVEVRLGKFREERTTDFTITRGPSYREPWVLRALLVYVATPEELLEVEETPDDSLGALWPRFWSRRDPRPETAVNEALEIFEGRVAEASRRFGVMEPGWQSDQGRIFIRLGDPDRVETIHADAYRHAGEIWYYYARHATYVFQDVDGFGRLLLVGGR